MVVRMEVGRVDILTNWAFLARTGHTLGVNWKRKEMFSQAGAAGQGAASRATGEWVDMLTNFRNWAFPARTGHTLGGWKRREMFTQAGPAGQGAAMRAMGEWVDILTN